MTTKGMSKAGPVTLALGLIGGGLALLLYNFGAVAGLGWLWKLRPVLLMGVGVEYFIKKYFNRDEEVHFHVPSIILILVLIIIGGAAYVATNRLLDHVPWHQEHMTYSRSWESGAVAMEPGDVLSVESKRGMVELLPAEGEELQVRAVVRAPETGPAREAAGRVNPAVEHENGGVEVTVPGDEDWWNGHHRVVTDLVILVPGGVDVEVQSGTGRVTANSLEGNIEVDGNTGTVELNNVAGKIEARNNTGRMEIKNPGGDVKAETNTGSIEMSAEHPLNGNYRLASSTGRVALEIPGDSDFKINAVSTTGNVSVTGLPGGNMRRDGPRAEYSNTMGSGLGLADLKVGTGSIQITVK